MGGRPQTEIVAVVPIIIVVTRPIPWKCEVRHLVLLETLIREESHRELVQFVVCLRIQRCHLLRFNQSRQRGRGLDNQTVARKMFWFQFQRLPEIRFPPLQSLIRESEDQIDTDIVESRFSCTPDTFMCLFRRMNTREELQVILMERLDSNAQPVDARPAKLPKLVRIDRSRIRLQRNFGVIADLIVIRETTENLCDM